MIVSSTPQPETPQDLASRVLDDQITDAAQLKSAANRLLPNLGLCKDLGYGVCDNLVTKLFRYFDVQPSWLEIALDADVDDRCIADAIVERFTSIKTEGDAQAELAFVSLFLEPAAHPRAAYRHVLTSDDLEKISTKVAQFKHIFGEKSKRVVWWRVAADNQRDRRIYP